MPQQPLGAQLREAMQRNDTASAQRLFQVYMADPRHAYVDGLQALDETGSYFYNRKEYSRSATLFALAESAYPDILDAHLDAATLYRQINRPDLERASLRRALRISPDNAQALRRLHELGRSEVTSKHT